MRAPTCEKKGCPRESIAVCGRCERRFCGHHGAGRDGLCHICAAGHRRTPTAGHAAAMTLAPHTVAFHDARCRCKACRA